MNQPKQIYCALSIADIENAIERSVDVEAIEGILHGTLSLIRGIRNAHAERTTPPASEDLIPVLRLLMKLGSVSNAKKLFTPESLASVVARKAQDVLLYQIKENVSEFYFDFTGEVNIFKELVKFYSSEDHLLHKESHQRWVIKFLKGLHSSKRQGKLAGFSNSARDEIRRLTIKPLIMLGNYEYFLETKDIDALPELYDFATQGGKYTFGELFNHSDWDFPFNYAARAYLELEHIKEYRDSLNK